MPKREVLFLINTIPSDFFVFNHHFRIDIIWQPAPKRVTSRQNFKNSKTKIKEKSKNQSSKFQPHRATASVVRIPTPGIEPAQAELPIVATETPVRHKAGRFKIVGCQIIQFAFAFKIINHLSVSF